MNQPCLIVEWLRLTMEMQWITGEGDNQEIQCAMGLELSGMTAPVKDGFHVWKLSTEEESLFIQMNARDETGNAAIAQTPLELVRSGVAS